MVHATMALAHSVGPIRCVISLGTVGTISTHTHTLEKTLSRKWKDHSIIYCDSNTFHSLLFCFDLKSFSRSCQIRLLRTHTRTHTRSVHCKKNWGQFGSINKKWPSVEKLKLPFKLSVCQSQNENNNNNKKKRERDPKAQQKREGEKQIRKLQSLQHLAAIFEYFVGF